MILRLLFLLLLAGPAQAQCVGLQCPPGTAGTFGSSTGASPPVLDRLTTPTECYSWRLLISSYVANKAMNVVRASDSATTDIGFTSTGAPDKATLTTFCAATTCKVVTAYSQCGARNITNATDANRPPVVIGCVGAGLLPCMQTTAGQSLLTSTNITPATGVASFSAVANRVSGTGSCTWMRENGNANRFLGRNAVANNWAIAGGTSGVVNGPTATDGAFHAGQAVLNGAASIVNIDGADGTAGSAIGNTAASTAGILGVAGTTCDYAELMFWDNVVLTSAERSYLGYNQRGAWGF